MKRKILSVITALAMWMILACMNGMNPTNMTEAKEWTIEDGISNGSTAASVTSRQ